MVTGQGNERIAAQAIIQALPNTCSKAGIISVTLPALIQKSVQAHRSSSRCSVPLRRNRYQALLLNNVRDAIVVWDLSGQITYWNPGSSASLASAPKNVSDAR